MAGFDFAAVKTSFFDSPAVQKMMNRKKIRALNHFGGKVRKTAKYSIRPAPLVDVKTGQVKRGRKAKGAHTKPAISKPGAPPFSHLGTLKNLIFYSYDSASDSVVVGPIPLVGKGIVPKALEHGGPSTKLNHGKIRKTMVRPRPFMKPAMDKVLPEFVGLFKMGT